MKQQKKKEDEKEITYYPGDELKLYQKRSNEIDHNDDSDENTEEDLISIFKRNALKNKKKRRF